MKKKRKALKVDVRHLVLHEAGYRCGNPGCRTILTLDIHHLIPVAEDGGDTPDNLLALCPNCHALHHRGEIPQDSIRAWKMLLLSLNEGFSRAAVDFLLALDQLATRPVLLSLDTLLMMGSLLTTGLIAVDHPNKGEIPEWDFSQTRFVSLSEKGRTFVAAWKAGRQDEAINSKSGK